MSGTRIAALVACAAVACAAPLAAQDAEKKSATLTVLVPDAPIKTALKIEGQPTKATGEKRVFTTPPLEAGKTYVYKVEATIVPNNYTEIFRTREVTFKAGEEVTLDIRPKDKDIADDVRIRWVPTPDDIVDELAKLGKVGKDDTVFDLGCGDAAMLIGAVKRFGAKKGVGIDIDPDKVKDALANSERAGIAAKIDIRKGNILDEKTIKDVADANVLMIYMGDEMNIRLRPMLWKLMKPGSRIVSHRFLMGDDWPPEKTVKVVGMDGDEYELHLWTITGKEGKKDDAKKDEPKKDEAKKDKK